MALYKGRAPSPTLHRASRLLEPGILVALALFSLVPVAAMVRHAIAHHLLLSGADAAFADDQFQYLSWVREYAHHLLAGNLMDVAPSSRVFLHPMFLLSGWASRTGLSVPDAYQLWKPVAAIALFVGFRAYVSRFLPTPRLRLVALGIALFYSTPAAGIAAWGSVGSFAVQRNFNNAAGELLPAEFLWGYLPSAISVALMPLFLLGVERLVRDSPAGRIAGRPRDLLAVSACGLMASWLHPWQGETLLVIVAAAVALDRFSRRYLVLAIPLIALTAPLVYYFVLSHADPAWRLAAHLNTRWGHVPLWALALCVLPLALPAALTLRKPSADLGERMLKLWPLAGAAVYLVLSPSFPQHALDGLSLPLAILAVGSLAPFRRRAAVIGGLAVVAILPGLAYQVQWMRGQLEEVGQPYYMSRDEKSALNYLARVRKPGAVFAGERLGPTVPAETGRETWIGHFSWTRDFERRVREADTLFAGRLPGSRAVALVKSSKATFVLTDCATSRRALVELRQATLPLRRFGCAGVYTLTPPAQRVDGTRARVR